MQSRIEKYLEDKESSTDKPVDTTSVTHSQSTLTAPSPTSTTIANHSLSILRQYLSKMIGHHSQQTTTNLGSTVSVSPKLTTTHNHEVHIVVDQHLEHALREIEHSSEQCLEIGRAHV